MIRDVPNVVLFFHSGDQEAAGCLLDLLLHVDDGGEARYFLQYGNDPNTLRIRESVDAFLLSRNAEFSTNLPDVVPAQTLIDNDPNLFVYPGPHTRRPRAWKRRTFYWNLCVFKYIHLLDHFQIIEPDCVILRDNWIHDIFEAFRMTDLPVFGHLKTGVIGGAPVPTHWAGCSYYCGRALRKLNLERWFFERYDNPWWPLRLEEGSVVTGNCFWGPAFSGYDISYDYFLYALYWKEATGSNDPRDWPDHARDSREDLILCDWRSGRSTDEILDTCFGKLSLLHGVKCDDTRNHVRRKFMAKRCINPKPPALFTSDTQMTIKDMKGVFSGERVVLIGNGPSLNHTNLDLLDNQYTIGLNRIYLLFEHLGYQTTFFVCVNKNVIEQFAEDIGKIRCIKFLSEYAAGRISIGKSDFLMKSVPKVGFKEDLSNHCWHEGWTVTYCGMQLAYHLGFSEVVLIGVDHHFQNSGDANKETKETSPDVNHFSPDYFGPGVIWQYPDLDRSEKSYNMAKKVFEKNGRRIVDCTVDGRLRVFTKDRLENVLAQPVPGVVRNRQNCPEITEKWTPIIGQTGKCPHRDPCPTHGVHLSARSLPTAVERRTSMNKDFDETIFSDLLQCCYANVRTYNKLRDSYSELTPPSGDLKSYQRTWTVDAILRNVPVGGRVVEIGAGGCELAEYIRKAGYDVWIVDPFDGSAGGDADYESVVKRFPHLTIVKSTFDSSQDLPTNYFHGCYSCSVIEHIPKQVLGSTYRKMYDSLLNGGVSIHSIDWTLKGIMVDFSIVEAFVSYHGYTVDLQRMASDALNDIDTYFLSPQGHYGWRKFLGKTYEEYPYRKVTSLDLVARK